MPSSPEQLAAAAKAHFEAQSELVTLLTSKTFEAVGKVIEINVGAAKTAMADGGAAALKGAKPNAGQAIDYGRQLAEVGEGVQAEFASAAEAHVLETRKALASLVDDAVRNAPPGSEAAIAMMQSVLANADSGFEKMMSESRKAVKTLQENVKTASGIMAEAGKMI